MNIVDTFLKYLSEALANHMLAFTGLAVTLFIGAAGIYFAISHHKTNSRQKIENRKTDLLTSLNDLIQEYKDHVYRFDADTFIERSQHKEKSMETAKSYHLNNRLDELFAMQSAFSKAQFKNIDEVEKSIRAVNSYKNSSRSMMKTFSLKVDDKK